MFTPNDVLQLRVLVQLVEHDVRVGAASQVDHQTHAAAPAGLVLEVGDVLDLAPRGRAGRSSPPARALLTMYGSSVTTRRPRLCGLSSIVTRARMRIEPRPVSYASLMPSRPMMSPAVGKSGPLTIFISSRDGDRRGRRPAPCTASITSPRLCGGMLVAMPTAMPDEPLTSRFGNRAGRTSGSSRTRRSSGRSRRSPCRCRGASPSRAARAGFGVSHGAGGVAVDRAEVALRVDQRVAHREVLRHPHQRVVDRRVAVRVVLLHHVADDRGALAPGLVGAEPALQHREQDAAVDGLQAVADVGEGTGDDDRHGVVDERGLDLLLDDDRLDALFNRHLLPLPRPTRAGSGSTCRRTRTSRSPG